jgi:chromosome segregation ATPase
MRHKLLAGSIGVLLLLGLLAVLAVPLYGTKEDTSSTEGLIRAQLVTLDKQLEVLETSAQIQRDGVAEARRTREATEQLLATAESTLDTAQRALAVAEQTRGDVAAIRADTEEGLRLFREQIALTRELLAVARQTLQEVREINRKTPPGPSSRVVP